MLIALPEEFVRPLLDWYADSSRPLPWRENPSPYRVWVSEVMLQQTRIEAAREHFLRFMEAFPDVSSLASASEERVLKQWEGLGYYSRARNLHKAAQEIVEKYNGELPDTYKQLRALPGVGDYTAGAIASIAFGLPEPAVDGNVLRVLSRLCASQECIGSAKVRDAFREALRRIYPQGQAAAFTQALMELGEVICTPGTPDCPVCPIAGVCMARELGNQTALPVMPTRRPRRIEERTVLLLLAEGRVAVRKRPERGLLAGLWEFPSATGKMCGEEALPVAESLGCRPISISPYPQAIHIFTHIEWHMTGYRIVCRECAAGLVWITRRELKNHAIPSAFRAFLRALESDRDFSF